MNGLPFRKGGLWWRVHNSVTVGGSQQIVHHSIQVDSPPFYEGGLWWIVHCFVVDHSGWSRVDCGG